MDCSYRSAFSTAGASALPSASLFHHAEIPGKEFLQYQKCQELILVQGLSIAARGKREISRQQWEEMKPLIWRVYKREHKTFRQLKNILRIEYGVEPTDRQFSRKVNEWGFKKNVSGSERRKILHDPPNRSHPNFESQNLRINPGKLQNWRKRYRKEESALSLSRNTLENSFNPTFSSRLTEVQDSPLESGHQGSELSNVQGNVSSQTDLDIAMSEMRPLESCDQWPFSWSTVDVPGSPGLSRLFAALELDELSAVPEFALQGAEVEISQTISITELSDLFNEKNKELVYDVDEARKLPRHNATYDYRKCKRGQILRRDLDQVFMGWSESPLTRELYPFPTSTIRNTSSFSFPRRDTTAFLEYDEAHLIDSLLKLEVSLLPNNRRIIATKQVLGQAYLSQNKLEEALNIFYQVYQQKLRIWGSTHLESLETRLDIARVFLRQSRYQPGLDFVEDIISEIKCIVSPEHEFAEEAAMTKAYFLVNLGNDEEAERIYRQSLQIRLNNYGPKDRKTLEAMRMLGVVLAKGNHTRNSEAEKLLRTTVQIYKETSDSPEAAMCQASGDLGWLQWTLTLDVDSYQVGQAALLRFESSLGPRHPAVLKIRLGIGWNLYGEGKFEESEREFRFLLALHSQSGNQSKLELQFILNGLAHSLWKLSRFEEAFSCIGRVIRGFREIFGPEDTGSSPACDRLGYSYEVQGRSEDAVELYWQMIKMLQGGGFSDHPAIAMLTMRIERLTSAQIRNFYY